jgi:hypothetical protein
LSSPREKKRRCLRARQQPALHPLDAGFSLGFVAGTPDSGRHHRGAVVLGQLLVAAVEVGIVETGGGDPGLDVIRDDQRRHPAQVLETAPV